MQAKPRLAAAMLLALSSISLTSCASGGDIFYFLRPPQITWNDTKWCVPLELKLVLNQIARKYGPVQIHSTFRWPIENARKGGKPHSYHLSCRAVDFSVKGDSGQVLQYIRSHPSVGGYSRYPQGFYHIDNGPRRTW
ncbi:MAG: DUF882 domain-containing protein [Nitratireductor sp.]|nr:DUF882 domain-containing protein [Nitratireductor sp.]